LRCVFDTNVLISALLLPGSKPRRVVDLALRRGTLLLSLAVVAEIARVLSENRFRRYVDEDSVRSFMAALTGEAEFIEVNVSLSACRDPKDNKFLELAVSGRASHIVTGDSDLLILDPYQSIRILSPNSFLESSSSEA
jgi:uncharacterized protein